MHDLWKGILLNAVREFAEAYSALCNKDAQSAAEQLKGIVQCFVGGHASLTINDLHDFQYDPQATFYRHLLELLENIEDTHLEAKVARGGWIRRHGDPRDAITPLSIIARTTNVSPTLRSTAGFEVAQAYLRLGNNVQFIEWLRISAAAAEEAGNYLQSLINQATAASVEAKTDPQGAKETLVDLQRQFLDLSRSNSLSERDTAERWYMNTTYDLAKIAAKTGDEDTLYVFIGLLESPEYRERRWITEAELQELRAAL